LSNYPVSPKGVCPPKAEIATKECIGPDSAWNDSNGKVLLPNVPQSAMMISEDNPRDTASTTYYLTGCMNYFDEFHFPHRTTFCEEYMPDPSAKGQFKFCRTGNDAY
jgi:hypothetical protein